VLQPIVEVIYAPLEGVFPGLMAAIETAGSDPFWSERDPRMEWYDAPLGLGPYNAFWEVALAWVYHPVFAGTAGPDQVEAFFRWLEWMALSEDRDVVNFMKTELCERIGNDPADTEHALPLMGLRSLEQFLDSERAWRSRVVPLIEAEIEARLTT
jgi:hypothetical protein